MILRYLFGNLWIISMFELAAVPQSWTLQVHIGLRPNINGTKKFPNLQIMNGTIVKKLYKDVASNYCAKYSIVIDQGATGSNSLIPIE